MNPGGRAIQESVQRAGAVRPSTSGHVPGPHRYCCAKMLSCVCLYLSACMPVLGSPGRSLFSVQEAETKASRNKVRQDKGERHDKARRRN
jgi:hypothetical protein